MTIPPTFLTQCDRDQFAGVRIKSCPEDFVVEEIPLYEPAGGGDHTWFWIEKRGLNTLDAAQMLAKALGKRPREAGIAGLKDAQAVARQWVSFEHVPPEKTDPLGFDFGEKLQVLTVNKHGNKLKMGHLSGNRFLIRLRLPDDAAEGAAQQLLEVVRAVFETVEKRGLPHFFGPQRFGRDGANPALGKLLVQGDEQAFLELAAQHGMRGRRAHDRKLRNLLVNAFQAQMFNAVLAQRMPDFDTLWPGDLAYLHRNGAVFAVEDAAAAEAEAPRCAAFEISASGPLFGPKMPSPTGKAGTLEAEVLAASGVAVEAFGAPLAQRQRGARRPLRVPLLESPRAELFVSDEQSLDEASETNTGVRLAFALPSGCYATVLLREILGDGPVSSLS